MSDRVTDDEREVVDLLAKAWNAFLELPIEHPTDQAEFCSAIHRCQNMVLGRVGRRQINRR